MGAFSLSVVISLPAVGFLSDMISRRILFMTGSLLMAVPTIFYPEARDMGAGLYILRALQGVGFSCAFGVAGAIVSESRGGADGTFFLGMLAMAGLLSQAVGPALGEYLIRISGYEALFRTAFLFGTLSFCASLFLGPGMHRRIPDRKGVRLSYPVLAATSVLGVVFGSMVIFLPPYLMTCGVNDSSPFFVSFVLGGFFVWTVFYRALKVRQGSALWMIMSLLLVIPLIFIRTAGSLVMLITISLIGGIGYGYLYPTLNAGMIGRNPASRGMANALFIWSFNVGMLAASIGFGYLCESAGYEKAFLMTAAAGFMLLAVSGVAYKTYE
jgi:MFS family permease